jgi:hypothetical protein
MMMVSIRRQDMNRIWKLFRRVVGGLGGNPGLFLTSNRGNYACCPAQTYSRELAEYEVMLTRLVR